jgi:hypothetical protein
LDFFVFRHQGCKPLAIVFATLEPQGSTIPHYSTTLTIALWVKPKESNSYYLINPVSVGLAKLKGLPKLELLPWTQFKDETHYIKVINHARALKITTPAKLELKLFQRR